MNKRRPKPPVKPSTRTAAEQENTGSDCSECENLERQLTAMLSCSEEKLINIIDSIPSTEQTIKEIELLLDSSLR